MEPNLRLDDKGPCLIDTNPPQSEDKCSKYTENVTSVQNPPSVHLPERLNQSCGYEIVNCERPQCKKTVHARINEKNGITFLVFHCPGKCHHELEIKKHGERMELANELTDTFKELTDTFEELEDTFHELGSIWKEQVDTLKKPSDTNKNRKDTLHQRAKMLKERAETLKKRADMLKTLRLNSAPFSKTFTSDRPLHSK